ncbi:MAG: ABC transporter permease [Bryobacteraceae bacterium]
MWKDIVFSFRTLRRSPLFTAVAVVSLALGIGANTAIFSLLDQVTLRSLPVADPERLLVLHSTYNAPGTSTSDSPGTSVYSYPMYRDLRNRDAAFSGMVARMSAGVTLTRQGSSEQADAEMVSGNFFRTLGVGAALGRVLAPDDDGAPGANPVAVLGYNYWANRLASSPAALNQTIAINGHPLVVVGVVEARFHGLLSGRTPDLYVPIAMQKAARPTWDVLEDRKFRWLNVFARLKPATTMQRAQAATDAVYRSILTEELARMGNMRTDKARDEFLNHRAQLKPAAHGINALGDQFGEPLRVMMAMVGLVLLIACANVANLMLARAAGRQREIAIRLAVGASRASLLKQLLVEGLMVSVAGGALGLLVARGSLAGLLRLLPEDVAGPWISAQLSVPLLGFTVALSVASGLLFALIPALQATNVAGGPARVRQALVVAQVALSLLLVVGAGLFTGSLRNLTRVNLGFRTQRLLMFGVNASTSRPQAAVATAFYRDFQARLAAIPGVTGVGAADNGPFSGSNSGGNLTVEGYQPGPDEYVGGSIVGASAGFFRALGIPLRGGREFTDRDEAGAPKVALVNEAFAKKYFAGRDPVGRHMMSGGSSHPVLDIEIVGVAADSRVDVRNPATETWYYPYAQWAKPDRLQFYVRTAGDESRVGSEIRQVLRAADPNVPMGGLKPMDVWIGESIYTERLIALLSGAFGLLATLLAAIGLYGVVAYAVARRTSEIGVRMALGARPAAVLRLILWEASRMALLGIAIGLAAALALSRMVESQLFGVKGAEPAVLALAAAVLALVALLAALAPGWRASRISPVAALKYE